MTMVAPRPGIRCPNCGKKFGDSLEGKYETLCPRCKRWVTIVRSKGIDLISKAE